MKGPDIKCKFYGMHISLTDRLDQYVRDQVASGLYSNVSEVIRDALRDKMEARLSDEDKLERLKAAINVGIEQAEQGEFADYSLQKVFDKYGLKA